MRKWEWGLGALALAGALLAAACGGDSKEVTPSGAISQASQTATLTASDFKFTPASLAAKSGQTLTLTLKNDGQATHTFTIDDLKIDQTLQPGQEVSVNVTPTKDGDLRFYCRFHAASSGMEGKITVGAAASTGSAQNQATTTAGSGGYRGY